MNSFAAWRAVLAAGLVIGSGMAAWTQESKAPSAPPSGLQRGRELALKYCATCHLFPEPELLTKSAWAHHIQPEMARWLGIERFDYEGNPDGKLLEEANLFPPSPILPEEDWFAIWDYYRAAAPSRPLPQAAKPPVRRELKQFRVRKLNPHSGAPMTSLVRILPKEKKLYLGDSY